MSLSRKFLRRVRIGMQRIAHLQIPHCIHIKPPIYFEYIFTNNVTFISQFIDISKVRTTVTSKAKRVCTFLLSISLFYFKFCYLNCRILLHDAMKVSSAYHAAHNIIGITFPNWMLLH